MTLTADLSDSPARWPHRSWLLLAAPLVGLAWWPLWAVVGAMATVGLARRWAWLRGGRLLALLLLGALGELPSWVWVHIPDGARAWQVADARLQAVQDSLPLLLGLGVLHTALWALAGGTRRLGLALLLLLLLGSALFGAGEPWALVAGVLGLLVAAAGGPGQEDRALQPLAGKGEALRRLTLTALGVGAVLAALSLPLPTQSDRNVRAGVPDGVAEQVALLLTGHFEDWRASGRNSKEACLSQEMGCAVAVGGVGARSVPTSKPSAVSSGDKPQASSAGQGQVRSAGPAPGPQVSAPVLAVAAVLLLVLAWLGRRRFRPRLPSPHPTSQTTPEAGPLPDPGASVALHRVRQAYRTAQAALTRAGLGRGESETPAEHAERVAAALPGAAEPLRHLLALYTPVRYGLSPSEEGAEQAEAAARLLAQVVTPPSTLAVSSRVPG